MLVREAIDHLLSGACPSIQYRVRSEVLREPASTREMVRLQEQILQDDTVKKIISSQQPDGWLGTCFHHDGGAEIGIRLLREKGVDQNHAVIVKALEAMSGSDETFARELFKVGRILDQKGLGGSYLIRAVVFAYAGMEDRPFVQEQIEMALEVFGAVTTVESVSEVVEEYRGRLVFRPDAKWPSIYHLRLLAFTRSWRTPHNREMIGKSIRQLVKISPIPNIHLRHKSQLIAPCAAFMDNFNPHISSLGAKGWMMWFHRMELLARLGVVELVPELCAQVNSLAEMLTAGGGRFAERMSHPYFTKWTAYSGLALEKDWKSPARRVFDLTFRSALILHYSQFEDWPSTG